MSDNLIYGWFDDAGAVPDYDPPVETTCVLCGHRITRGDVSTHSLMYLGQYAARSYFYRTHKSCAATDTTGTGADEIVLNMIQRNGD